MTEQVDTTNEIWKPVAGWEGVYSVSSWGNIRRDLALKYHKGGKQLNPHMNPFGYMRILLQRKPRKKEYFVHQLVATAFIGPKPDGHEVNHKDANRANNKPGNLEWVTRSQNMLHAIRRFGRNIGTNHYMRQTPEKIVRGEQCWMAKLTEADVLQIREQIRNREQLKKIAAAHRLDPSTIAHIKSRKSWSHI